MDNPKTECLLHHSNAGTVMENAAMSVRNVSHCMLRDSSVSWYINQSHRNSHKQIYTSSITILKQLTKKLQNF